MWVAFANAKAPHIFLAKNISDYAIFNDQSFNNKLTNDSVSFEQMGPELLTVLVKNLNKSSLLPFDGLKIARWMANCVDPDQMPPCAAVVPKSFWINGKTV